MNLALVTNSITSSDVVTCLMNVRIKNLTTMSTHFKSFTDISVHIVKRSCRSAFQGVSASLRTGPESEGVHVV